MLFVSFLLFHIKVIKRGKNEQEAELSIINLFFHARELQMEEDITKVVKAKEYRCAQQESNYSILTSSTSQIHVGKKHITSMLARDDAPGLRATALVTRLIEIDRIYLWSLTTTGFVVYVRM